MNRKTWFYGALITLLVFTATYITFTADGTTWGDFKGRSGCYYGPKPSISAGTPGPCSWSFGCDPVITNGVHGRCVRVDHSPRKIKAEKLGPAQRIIKQERMCKAKSWKGIPIPKCKDLGTKDPTYGKLTECYLTAC